MSDTLEPKFLADPYRDFINAEGIPIHEDFGFDLLALDLAPWPRIHEW